MAELPWIPGGARGGDRNQLQDGRAYLLAVRLAGTLTGGEPWTDWHVVAVERDEDGLVFHSDGGWKWRWEDVSWCLPVDCLRVPGW